jgi:hypothetical protein
VVEQILDPATVVLPTVQELREKEMMGVTHMLMPEPMPVEAAGVQEQLEQMELQVV